MVKKRVKKKRGQSAAFMRSINPRLNGGRKIKYKKIRTMARRKKRTSRRYGRKSSSVMGFNMAMVLGAMGYGAIRSYTSNLVAPYTSKIPLGSISDEVGLLAITTLGKKFIAKKKGIIRDVLSAGQVIELARIGETLVSGGFSLGGTTSSGTSGYTFA